VTAFEYPSVFISLVIGPWVVHVLSPTARMVTDPRIRPYWVPHAWCLNLLYSLAFFRWFAFNARLRSE